MKSTSHCSLVDDKMKKWRVKTLLGPLAWLHRKFGPPLNSHLIIPSGPTFLSLVNNDPFLLPSFFSLLQIVIALEIVWPVCSSDHFLSWLRSRAICSIFVANPSKTPEQRVSVWARLACWQTYVFYFAKKVIQPRGKVLHNRPRKMYDTITSARQLTLNLAAFLHGP